MVKAGETYYYYFFDLTNTIHAFTKTMLGEYYNIDCMELMARYPNKYFDLAIVDPPYGIGFSAFTGFNEVKRANGSIGYSKRKNHSPKEWDNLKPNKKYFSELFRVSKDQIIWGSNYYELPPTKGIICWDKKQNFQTFSAFELAWTSFDYVAKIFRYDNKGFMNDDGGSIHPTQKPVKLYEWLLANYAKPNDLILDTHCGSASSLIACENLGFKYIASELDKDYYEQSLERLKTHLLQGKLFQPVGGGNKIETPSMFA